MNPIDKLDLKSPDFVTENIQKLADSFPHCVTETADGKRIDFDQLQQELSHAIVEGNRERYRLEWPGKREAIVTANLPTTNTLRPVPEDSVDFDNTENIYIEGDNLEVLKLLQESYFNKIKMIYIDPPYNTGNDFVYKDNFATDRETELRESGQIDEYNQRLVANPESAGRYHSDWLSMMYPRLKLARNLLTDDGVIFISIDDNEVHNLRKMCDEVFGDNNFVAQVIWERAYSPVNLKKHFSENHDYIICYSKSIEPTLCNGLPRSNEANDRYKNPDNDVRGVWKSADCSVGPVIQDKVYPITTPSGRVVLPPDGRCWLYTKPRFEEMLNDNRIWFGDTGNNVPSVKKFLSEVKNTITPMTIWKYDEVGHSQEAAQNLKKLFDGKDFFDYPKPIGLIKRCLELYSNSDSIILDFYSGSATTAHAVMQLNAEDGGNRKYIMVQLPEQTDEKSEAYKAGYPNICEIGKERIRRASKQIVDGQLSMLNEKKAKLQSIVNCQLLMVNGQYAFPEDAIIDSTAETLLAEINNLQLTINHSDFGFRVFRLDSSNMQDVYYLPQNYKQDTLDMFADNIKSDRTNYDLLVQVMLDWGLPLSYRIEQLTINGKQVFRVAENSLYACFDHDIDENFAKAIAKEKPLRVVFRDSGFANDTAKINVKQLLKQLSPETEMKVI